MRVDRVDARDVVHHGSRDVVRVIDAERRQVRQGVGDVRARPATVRPCREAPAAVSSAGEFDGSQRSRSARSVSWTISTFDRPGGGRELGGAPDGGPSALTVLRRRRNGGRWPGQKGMDTGNRLRGPVTARTPRPTWPPMSLTQVLQKPLWYPPPPPFVRCSHGVMGWRGLLVGGRGPRRGAAGLGRAPWLLRANHNDDQALHNRHRQCLAANLGSATLAGGTFKGLRAVYGHVSAFCGYLAAGRLLVDLPPTAHMAPKRREKIQGAVAGGSICRWIWGHRDQRR